MARIRPEVVEFLRAGRRHAPLSAETYSAEVPAHMTAGGTALTPPAPPHPETGAGLAAPNPDDIMSAAPVPPPANDLDGDGLPDTAGSDPAALVAPPPEAAPPTEQEILDEANRRAAVGGILANVGGAYQRFLQNAYGVSPDPAGTAALRRQAQAPVEQARQQIAAQRYGQQQEQATSQQEALRQYLASRYGTEGLEGLSTGALGDVGQQAALSERAAQQQALQQYLQEQRAAEAERGREFQHEEKELDRAARLEAARVKAKKGRGGRGGGTAPTDDATLLRAAGGDRGLAEAAKRDPKLRRTLMANLGRIGTRQQGPEFERELQEYSKRMAPLVELTDAIENAIATMSAEEAAGDISGFGQTGAVPEVALSPQGKKNRQALAEVRNLILRARSGGAVSEGEASRLLEELGEGNLKTDEQLMRGLRRLQDKVRKASRNVSKGFQEDVVKAFHDPAREQRIREARGEAPATPAAPAARRQVQGPDGMYWQYADGRLEKIE